jgi:hypothetical protein
MILIIAIINILFQIQNNKFIENHKLYKNRSLQIKKIPKLNKKVFHSKKKIKKKTNLIRK